MTDVRISENCACLDPKSGKCHITGVACPMSAAQQAECTDACFVARVVLTPDEFDILLDGSGKPRCGVFPLKVCRDVQFREGHGAHVNAILPHGPDAALLETSHHSDGSIEFSCSATDASIVWRDGAFSPR